MRVREISKIVLYYVKIHRKHIGKSIVVHNLKEAMYLDLNTCILQNKNNAFRVLCLFLVFLTHFHYVISM